ncbi:hypothetical protein SBA3_2300021 [Candidatus Sulfopaludibacter sp. SbA3]|nr:hypothetical protein SBA3_2300021 [Candidatus Sulfopaludibacter sp. SbA3]
MASQGRKWFTNRGQMLQVSISALALVVAGRGAWKGMLASQFLSLGALLFYALVGLVIASFTWMIRSNRASGGSPSPKADEGARQVSETVATIPDDAPSLLVHYFKSEDGWRKLRFSNEKPLTAIIRNIWPIVSSERYEAAQQIDLLPGIIPPISFGNPVECSEVSQVSLIEVLREGTEKTMDSVVIDYDDSHNHQYSRQFTLTRNLDMRESIAWIPGPICLRGQVQTPVPSVESLGDLREKLRMARAFPIEQQAAQQYLSEAKDAQEQVRILSWKVDACQKASVIWSLEGDVKRLEERLGRLLNVATTLEGLLDFELSRLLERPLSTIDPRYSDSINKIDAWKFQDDFMDLRKRLLPYGSVSLDILAYTVPNDISGEDVQGVLSRTAHKLSTYAASLFEPPQPTIS